MALQRINNYEYCTQSYYIKLKDLYFHLEQNLELHYIGFELLSPLAPGLPITLFFIILLLAFFYFF